MHQQNQVEEDDWFLIVDQSPQINAPCSLFLQQYLQQLCQCSLEGQITGLDKFQVPLNQFESQTNRYDSARSSRTDQHKPLDSLRDHVIVEDEPEFQDLVFKLPAVYQQSQPQPEEPPVQQNIENDSLLNGSMAQRIVQYGKNIQAQNQLTRNQQKKTSNAPGYIILHAYKQIVNKNSPFLEYICQQYDYSLTSLIEFCDEQIKTRKNEYIEIKKFKKMLREKKQQSLILRKFFIKYLEDYTAAETKTQKKVHYITCAKKLRQAIISLNGGKQLNQNNSSQREG